MLNCLEFKAEDFIPVMEEAISNNCSIVLIKSRGIYFAPELPTQSKANEFVSKVAFAKGCNPLIDNDWATNCNRLGGGVGTRFLEYSTKDPILQMIYKQKSDFQVFANEFGIEIIL